MNKATQTLINEYNELDQARRSSSPTHYRSTGAKRPLQRKIDDLVDEILKRSDDGDAEALRWLQES